PSVSAIPSALTQLRTLVRDNPSQLQRVDTLTPLGTSFLAVLERLHEDFRPGHVTPEEVTLVNRTRIQLDGIRSILDRMRNEESQLLAVRRGSEADASRTASIVIAVSIPLALLIGVGAILLFTAGIGRRVQQVAENARRLQREEPLLPLPPAADEIGALGRTLEEAAALLMQRRGALARSEERYRTLARNLPKGIVAMFDRDLRYTMVEGPGLPSLGLSREALEGKTLQETAEPHNIAVVEPHYRGTLEGRTSVFELPVRGRTLLLHFLPLEDEEGAVT